MTSNPLTMARPAFAGYAASMNPGESRTYTARDPKTGDVVKEITIHRTTRDYVYDLCDAYNAARLYADTEYFVLNGEVKLGLPSNGQRPQGEYRPTDEDMARIREYVAAAAASPITQEQFNAHVRKTGGCPRL